MARCLAGRRPQDRDSVQAAALILLQEGYGADDVAEGLDAALELARSGIRAAASDHPIARAIALGRDLAACAAILAGGVHLTGWFA